MGEQVNEDRVILGKMARSQNNVMAYYTVSVVILHNVDALHGKDAIIWCHHPN